MKTVSFRLPEEVVAQLAAAARARGQSTSAVVRTALERCLASGNVPAQGSCLDLAADLVGCTEGARDLSVHKRHLRGYGE
jgi:plasmid stability protein